MPIRYKHIVDNERQPGPKYRYAIFNNDKIMFHKFKRDILSCKYIFHELYAILNKIVYIKFI